MTLTGKDFDAAAQAERSSPLFAAGIRRIRQVLATDGALSAADKALLSACAAATQYLPALTVRSLESARERGLDAETAIGASLILMLNRGETAFQDFGIAIEAVFADPPPAAAPAADEVVGTTAEALAYFTEHFGAVPPRQRLFAELSPVAFQGYYLMHRAALKQNVLSHKTAELVLCSVIAATADPALLEIHVRSALAAGASFEEVTEAVLAAIPAAGLTVWSAGAAALANARPQNTAS